jgi:uncharacterized protein YcbK (DUF882 family)
MYTPKYFAASELVDSITHSKFGDSAIQLFNPLALQGLDKLRDHFGKPIVVNNWKIGGPFSWRGLRTLDCTTGVKWSQHRLGSAFDCDIQGISVDEARSEIIKQKGFGLITCIEVGVPWVHFDVRNIDVRNGLLQVRG